MGLPDLAQDVFEIPLFIPPTLTAVYKSTKHGESLGESLARIFVPAGYIPRNPPMVDCPAWEMPRTWRSATPIHVPSTALSSYGRVGVNAPPIVAWDPASAHG